MSCCLYSKEKESMYDLHKHDLAMMVPGIELTIIRES